MSYWSVQRHVNGPFVFLHHYIFAALVIATNSAATAMSCLGWFFLWPFAGQLHLESHAHGGRRMLAWPFCVDMNRAEEVQLFRKSREVSLRSNGNGGSGVGSNEVALNELHLHHANKPQRTPEETVGRVTALASSTSACRSSHHNNDEQLLLQRRRFDADASETGVGVKQEMPDRQIRPPPQPPPPQPHHQRRMPRFGEAHHRRVPTPLKKRRKPREDFVDLPTPSSDADDAAIVEVVATGDAKPAAPPGVPDPYYPIYLPIDQAFKAKYVFHQRKGKTFQERVYVFLEHPCGWICFIYHFAV